MSDFLLENNSQSILEQDLNSLFQIVKNGQQYISELRNENDENETVYTRGEQQRR